MVGRYFDNAGNAQGAPFQLSRDDGFSNSQASVAGLPIGAVIAWSESILELGVPLFVGAAGQATHVGGSPMTWDVTSTSSGGFVVAWTYYTGESSGMKAQVFGALGTPLGSAFPVAVPDPFPPGSGFTLSRVAASPVGGVIAAAGFLPGAGAEREIVVYRFSDTGTMLGAITVGLAAVPGAGSPLAVYPDVGFDFAGNMYVAWGDAAPANAGVHVRAYDPGGSPLGASLRVATETPAQRVRVAGLPNGSFVNAWSTSAGAWANVVSLCQAGSAICGDGVLSPACERCDDGAGNDDAAPDACRTDCLPAHCGDGAVDGGEQCDDGNLDACDGCDAFCDVEAGIVCGDGIVGAGLRRAMRRRQRRRARRLHLACRLERIPGGGKTTTDCLIEWSIDNPANVPALDKRGFINVKQRCVDGDPRCDFDGTPGRLHLPHPDLRQQHRRSRLPGPDSAVELDARPPLDQGRGQTSGAGHAAWRPDPGRPRCHRRLGSARRLQRRSGGDHSAPRRPRAAAPHQAQAAYPRHLLRGRDRQRCATARMPPAPLVMHVSRR